jgi:hypothetical protein
MFWAKTRPAGVATTDFGEMAPRTTPDGVIRVRSLAGSRRVVGGVGAAVGDRPGVAGALVPTVARAVAVVVAGAAESGSGALEQPGTSEAAKRAAATERVRCLPGAATVSAEPARRHVRVLVHPGVRCRGSAAR